MISGLTLQYLHGSVHEPLFHFRVVFQNGFAFDRLVEGRHQRLGC